MITFHKSKEIILHFVKSNWLSLHSLFVFSEIVAIYCMISIERKYQLAYSINLLKQVRSVTIEKDLYISK